MIANVPVHSNLPASRMEFDHLLLGDLRQLLNDPSGRERDRWLLATLDMLLVSRPRPPALVYLPILPREQDLAAMSSADRQLPIPFERLQRLRDRIAHHAPSETLMEELNADLSGYFAATSPTRTADSLLKR